MTAPRSRVAPVAMIAVIAMIGLAAAGCADTGTDDRFVDSGEPSLEEHELWYSINRARADPSAEGERLLAGDDVRVEQAIDAFGVDRARVAADFESYPPRPPVAWNSVLAEAARRHAAEQVERRTQQHLGADGSGPRDRIVAASRDAGLESGLNLGSVQENVASSVWSPWFAHAAFQIDWGGPPPTGVQGWPTPGHRNAVMNFATETSPTNMVGIAWLDAEPDASAPDFGPFVVVQDFAVVDGVFVVGTVWDDGDADGEFDPGEGVGGVEVRVAETSTYTLTGRAGGYVLPVEPDAVATIEVTIGREVTVRREIDVGARNVLFDVVNGAAVDAP